MPIANYFDHEDTEQDRVLREQVIYILTEINLSELLWRFRTHLLRTIA